MLFINNKYTSIYFKIVNRAVNRILTEYTERHHIIPVSLGGTNDRKNIVKLTAKEHYIVHLLLPHMVSDLIHKRKMYAAIMCMTKMHSQTPRRHISIGSSRFYEISKQHIDFGASSRGRKQPIEERQKRANSLRGHITTEETRRKIGDANRGRKLPPVTDATRKKLSEAGKGRKLSDESRKKLSDSSKKRGHNGFKGKGSRGPASPESWAKYHETVANRPDDWKQKPHDIVTCPHCEKSGGAGRMKRYHFDNCKNLSDSSRT